VYSVIRAIGVRAGDKLGDSGAAAVEFALLALLLITLVLGIFEFGDAYFRKISLSAAAREGAREMAIHKDTSDAIAVTIASAAGMTPALSDVTVSTPTDTCLSGSNVTVTARQTVQIDLIIVHTSRVLTGRGVMRCGG
jgi:Flp pilus assembly protein TadG